MNIFQQTCYIIYCRSRLCQTGSCHIVVWSLFRSGIKFVKIKHWMGSWLFLGIRMCRYSQNLSLPFRFGMFLYQAERTLGQWGKALCCASACDVASQRGRGCSL